MKKQEFVKAVSEKTKISQKEISLVIKSVFENINALLSEGGKIQFKNFGTFKVIKRKAKVGRNPINGDKVNIPAQKVPKFVASKTLKNAVK